MCAHSKIFAMSSFPHELAGRAWDSAITSMSTSLLALISAVAYGIYRIILSHKRDGWQGVRKHSLADGVHALIFGVCWWVLLFSYHFFLKVPRAIENEASRQYPPKLRFIPSPPPFAALKTERSLTPSFIFAVPAFVVVPNGWGFVIKHVGPHVVESIDLLFTDSNKLERIQKTTDVTSPREYSIFQHYDKVYPKGRGALFARQLIWAPIVFEHERYAIDISASTGRFHEDLFIEQVDGKWVNAAKVEDMETKKILFVCRDSTFPKSVAFTVVTRKKCWPDWIK
jgi:hypothetical protein